MTNLNSLKKTRDKGTLEDLRGQGREQCKAT